MEEPKISKTCNECKARKVKCEMADTHGSACNNCKRRNVPCHFRPKKKRDKPAGAHVSDARPKVIGVSNVEAFCSVSPAAEVFPIGVSAQSLPSAVDTTIASITPGNLYIDSILENGEDAGRLRNESSILKAHDKYVGSSNIAFFSDQRIASISERLGHTKFLNIFSRLNNSVDARMDWDIRSKSRSTNSKAPSAYFSVEPQSVNLYIASYFEQVHPIYPFLQRHEFERKALDNRCSQFCEECAPFSALYHTVLALGCQRLGGETFQLGCSPSWKLFQVALGLFAEMITTKETLVHVQAMTAMAIFARNSSGVQIERLLTTEAARIAQFIGINRAIYANEDMDLCRRAFWTIYVLEKTQTFACGRDSILIDSNIGTPVPQIPDAVFDGFDYFHALCRFSRVLSKAKDALFSISATLIPSSTILNTIDALNGELERWRKSIGKDFRPGNSFQQSGSLDSLSIRLKLMLSYQYYSAVIALARLKLNVASWESDPSKLQAEQVLLHASRSIVELTRYIDVETYTPIWILLSVPLSAIFILFDFVIHNPCHSETKNNIALLGIAAGYFCRLEFSSGGRLQTSLLSDLAQIARDYISGMEFLGTPYSCHHSQPDEHETGIRPVLPASGEESLATVQDSLREFSEGVDLTSFFATELPDFVDPSIFNLL